MARPGQDADASKNGAPQWMIYGARGFGTTSSCIAIFLGVWNCLGIVLGEVFCLIFGMWQIVLGIAIIVCEAPCCCCCLHIVQQFSNRMDNRPYWNKAVAYICLAIPPIYMCTNLLSVIGCGLIIATGVIYALIEMRKSDSDCSPTGSVSSGSCSCSC